jgi:hypothetical protein
MNKNISFHSIHEYVALHEQKHHGYKNKELRKFMEFIGPYNTKRKLVDTNPICGAYFVSRIKRKSL